jgi:Ca-activated chloride channel family protein
MILHCKEFSRRHFPLALYLLLHFCAPLSLLFLLFVAPNTSVFAQDDSSSDVDVIRVRTDLIIAPVSVTDASGRRIYGLTQEDFALTDDGRPAKIEYFAVGTERVALAFALDASGSSRDILTHQRETALALLARFGRGSRVAVLRFWETAELVVPFTTRASEALSALNFPARSGSHTAIFDAAQAALRAFDSRDASERRIVILISDGLDTASTTKASKVIDEALERGISFYVIHLPLFEPRDGQLAARPASKGFRDLAEKTGGKYFMLGDAKSALMPRAQYDLAPVFQAIDEDLRGQYLLGYYPEETARDALPHRIEVSLASGNNKRFRVQTLRRGYVLKNAL